MLCIQSEHTLPLMSIENLHSSGTVTSDLRGKQCCNEYEVYKRMFGITIGISVPPILKRRGRPKGHELTVVSLSVKKPKKASDTHKT